VGVGFSQEYCTGCVEGNPPDMLHNLIMAGNEYVEHQDKGVSYVWNVNVFVEHRWLW